MAVILDLVFANELQWIAAITLQTLKLLNPLTMLSEVLSVESLVRSLAERCRCGQRWRSLDHQSLDHQSIGSLIDQARCV